MNPLALFIVFLAIPSMELEWTSDNADWSVEFDLIGSTNLTTWYPIQTNIPGDQRSVAFIPTPPNEFYRLGVHRKTDNP